MKLVPPPSLPHPVNKAQPQITVFNLLYLFFFLIPPFLILIFINSFAVNVPFADEWALTPMVVKLHTGGFTLNDLVGQHNEHRILFLRLLLLGLAKLDNWNIIVEAYAGFVFQVLYLLVVWRLLRFSLKSHRFPLLLIAASFMVFSAVQSDNWISGFLIVWPMLNFSAIFAVWLTTRWAGNWRSFVPAVITAIVATYTLASGFFLWPAVLFGLILRRRVWGWKYIAVWIGAGVISTALYFYNYKQVVGHPSSFYFLQHPVEFSIYVLSYLGGPLAIWAGDKVAALFGLVALILLAGTSYWVWQKSIKARSALWERILPWLELALFALFNALITGVGRSGFGEAQALSSRYTTIGISFWLSLGAVLVVAYQEFQNGATARNLRIVRVLTGVTLLILSASYAISYNFGLREVEYTATSLKAQLPYLYEYSNAPDNTLAAFFPDTAAVKNWAWTLEQYREGPFSITPAQYFQNYNNDWREKLSISKFKVAPLPAAFMTMTYGDKTKFKDKGDHADFVQEGKLPVNIYIDSNPANSQVQKFLPGYWNGSALDIESIKAYFIQIYWNTGTGLNGSAVALPFGQVLKDGYKHFRIFVPDNMTGFRVDIYYPNSREKDDSLKIEVYSRK